MKIEPFFWKNKFVISVEDAKGGIVCTMGWGGVLSPKRISSFCKTHTKTSLSHFWFLFFSLLEHGARRLDATTSKTFERELESFAFIAL
jgi:hypothetical protein